MNTFHRSTSTPKTRDLPYDPSKLKRELAPSYMPISDQDLASVLKTIGSASLDDLFSHISEKVKFDDEENRAAQSKVGSALAYDELIEHVKSIASKNTIRTSFIGDGLKQYRVPEIVPLVCNLRGLTTAYTPYQPERGQGTLQSLWIYSSLLSMLTGFEAINASLYDRSTAIMEALVAAKKLKKGTHAVLCNSIYPGDKEVLLTAAKETDLSLHFVEVDARSGTTSVESIREKIAAIKAADATAVLCALVFPQVNSLGNLEDGDALTDLAKAEKLASIAVIDPMLLAQGGLKAPSLYGSAKEGVTMIVGEGQHLALAPSSGGPGLGIFGIRYNQNNRMDIRSTPGRYVGSAVDSKGRSCKTLVLATREQHIRREKATSNICSNQAFMGTLVGAALLNRGDEGMSESIARARSLALTVAQRILVGEFKGVSLAFASTPFFNEFTIEIVGSVAALLEKARTQYDLHLGVDVSSRSPGGRNLLLLSFFDHHSDSDLQKLLNFFEKEFPRTPATYQEKSVLEIPSQLLRAKSETIGIPKIATTELHAYYKKLSDQNVSPDDQIYALGSCTMKYNPYVNDYLASLASFTQTHPQAPEADLQGTLAILYETQELFKAITGLQGVTTQPVAGAHGEFTGLKLFQAYHRDHGEGDTRKIILIPHSAHGTNPATANAAGYEILEISANSKGMIDFEELRQTINTHGSRIAGVMVTNPNTFGIFEVEFQEMASLIHNVGGLVYMDGANMNAIAGRMNLAKLGVDAVHNNLHKTWSISHGGGGPGDAIVAVSERLLPYLPGVQVKKEGEFYKTYRAPKSIGSLHRHFGNFLHKVRCYAYLRALGWEGIRKMSAVAVASSRYLQHHLSKIYPTLPVGAESSPRMHEFILTLPGVNFERVEKSVAGLNSRPEVIARVGKLFLDFGVHAPTVAFPEPSGLMVEPTESFTKAELDRFVDIVKAIYLLINETPEVLQSVPHFTPVGKIDEVSANKNLMLSEKITWPIPVLPDRIRPDKLHQMSVGEICKEVIASHKNGLA
ncbi:MAG: aminomethyl-transferring glycine dehydrogenase subunit GcvPB [Oligoflexia bacterium]|nr:aminomethyl-transferring glycine dehydrogenase subunit GcvPB [Oligoflexia bacterium]MBF0367707.1 aminomethyl-transferring glycine dehydrogenase subunit GcvPB [Oligoflexia bacterium]